MKDVLKGKRVGVILSGGNVDLERFCALTTE
jgi:threonine dehydratase